ncbi:MAG: Dam family site-specific DNA-(adenine-N6)-methyltransferase [Endomicrobium sp.]|jgi:DNA adenine methylase|nr:Dam family site-specific DNA-(adenine-N6)-methyltransferase [Endomicrobium sp.]
MIATSSQLRRSPFFYVGDKFKLIPQLKANFPAEINRFIEPFCGGGSVFLNVDARGYLLNDIDSNMINLHKFLQSFAGRREVFWEEVFKLISYYDLSATFMGRDAPEELRKTFVKTYFAQHNKAAYHKMRDDYNATQNPLLLYLLLIYGFNRFLRFNSVGKFNLPVGNVDFNKRVEKALNEYFDIVGSIEIRFFNMDFEAFIDKVKPAAGDMVYLDPPYLITFSEYNKLWDEDSEMRLIDILDRLNEGGIRFAVSNILWHRERYNGIFNRWAQQYNIVRIKSNYISYHDNTEKDSFEVLVKNY